MRQNGIVWISRETLSLMEAEGERTFPVETGGVFIGYWVKPYEEVVITHATGPGPKAVHKSHSFLPDSEYQEAEIERHYQNSERIHTYLGDWHSHGAGEAYLSRIDKKTLQKIAEHEEARTPIPLMAVLGEGHDWVLKVWRYKTPRFGKCSFGIKTLPLKPVIYP